MDFSVAQHQIHEQKKAKPQPEQALKCPRCDSTNTKFCYYNNYSLSQPRYFCKSCRRYWTKGGTLRNVPVGGGCRKKHRQSPSASPAPTSKISLKTLDHSNNFIYSNFKNEPSVISSFSNMGQGQIDLNLAFAMLHKQSLYASERQQLGFDYTQEHLPILGNANNMWDVLGNPIRVPGAMLGNGTNSSYRGNVEEVGVHVGNPNPGFARNPWQMNHGDASGIDQIQSGKESGSSLISSSWHGLLNSPLM